MFANIRRHQKWLWILISSAVIISFVWYFNPNSRQGAGGMFGNSTVGRIANRSISRTEAQEASKEAQLKYLFNYGSWHGSDEFSRQNPEFIDREMKNRIFLKEKIKEHGIHVTPEEVAAWIREAFGRGERNFSDADYDRFIKQTLQPKGIHEADFERYVRTEVGVMHLANVAGMAGKLVTPQQAETLYRRENEQVAAQGVFFLSTNFVAQVNMDPAEITKFYNNQQATYREPEKVVLAFVEFSATNFYPQAEKLMAGITNLNQMVEQMYQQRGTNYYTDANNLPMSPEAAKEKIKQEEKTKFAVVEARKVATQFAQELLDMPGARQTANLENLAAAKGLIVKTTQPFSQFQGPTEMEVTERFGQMAFMLTPGDPYIEEPIVGGEAVYVAALKAKVPSRIPALAEIQDRVTDHYRREQSRQLATQAGQAFYTKLTNAIAGGKSFADAALELGQAPLTLQPFSQSARMIVGLNPMADSSAVKTTAFSLKEGETSPYSFMREGGFILHVTKLIPATDDAVKAALPTYLTTLQRAGQSEAFNNWFTKELQESHMVMDSDRHRQSDTKDAQPPGADAQ